MKKTILSVVLACLALAVIVSGTSVSMTNAEDTMNYVQGTIFVNGVEIETEDTILIGSTFEQERTMDNTWVETDTIVEYMLFPLQTVLKALGADVIVEESTGNIYFSYFNNEYICEFTTPNPSFPNNTHITIKGEHISNGALGNYIPLSPMSGSGAYLIIDNKIYLYQQTGQRLLEALGCRVVIDSEQCVLSISNNSEVGMRNKWAIYVNDVEISSEATVLTIENEIFIPLRAVFEALNSEVVWGESTGNIYFDYAGIEYVCKFIALNPAFPEQKSILVCKVEDKDSISNTDYIQLNPMSADGEYRIINGRTYLYQQTGQRLLEALGCRVEIDLAQRILRIYSADSPSVSKEISVILNGTPIEFDVAPIIENNRTLVPFRGIFEALGAEVNWNNDAKTATGELNNISIQLTIGNQTAYVNKQPILLDVPPKIINGRTLVPIRFIVENFGFSVDWTAETGVIVISTN